MQRRKPAIGARVEVATLGSRLPGAIVEVSDDERRLVVETDAGERIGFALSRATGRFAEAGSQTGARLLFSDPPE
ncbi:MAG: hypothetical protein QOF37_446 [Thermoleophilaceae bacterium]|nr:hypothetical protein [Thermoleophilaceae bacterium]